MVSLSGCVAASGADDLELPREVLSQEQPIVYGQDDREELYQVEDPVLREIARSSVAALIESVKVHRLASGDVRIAPTSLKDSYQLCDGERFVEQPAAATCSGVLIDEDLVITAGHCVETDEDCKKYSFVFDYAYGAEGELEDVSASDVYGCRRLVARTFTETKIDFAIVQLDRVPSARAPLPVRRGAMVATTPVVAMGFTSGLPLKVDRGAVVQEGRSSQYDFFALNSDTFEGSSGSAILDENYQLAGVLVRGGNDYQKTSRGCSVAEVVPADAGVPEWRWEQATYAGAAVDALCNAGYPSQLLCGVGPRCGDGVCSLDPVDENCPVDCAEFCRENACTKGVGSAAPGAPVAQRKGKRSGEDCSVSAPGAPRHGPLGVASWAVLGLGLLARRRRTSVRARRSLGLLARP